MRDIIQKIVLLSTLIAFVTVVNAQSKQYTKKERSTFLDADSYYIYGDYLTAKNLFLEIYATDSLFPEINYKIGDAYYELKKLDSAMHYLARGVEYNLDAKYLIAKIYLHNGDLAPSKRMANGFKSEMNLRYSIYTYDDVDRLIEQINYAEEMMASPESVRIVNLGKNINTENAEYVPLIASDESVLVFTSRRIREGNGLSPTGEPFEDIYISRKNGDEWEEAKPIEGQVNTPKHDACVGLSPDGERLFVYRSNKNLIGGDIYESVLVDGKWSVPIKMGDNINNEESIEPSASMSLDEKTFYFSSNREGGYGGFDIYRVKMLPFGKWSEPKNLGPTINTPYDDDAPFIHPDGKTLYFSSKGHQGMGGFDIFKSEYDGDKWSKVENLGFPTNTTKDDIYFVISANKQHGYYASDKKGGYGKHDIYMIDYLEKSLRQSVVRGNVSDKKSGEKLYANINVHKKGADMPDTYIANGNSGDFIFLVDPDVSYEIEVKVMGYEKYITTVNYSVEELMKAQNINFELTKIAE